MHAHAIPAASMLDDYLQLFADTVAEQFEMPARDAVRRINAELGRNPLTRHVRMRLRDLAQELQVRPSDVEPL